MGIERRENHRLLQKYLKPKIQLNKNILMAESSDIYHDYRVQKEASSLASAAGYALTVLDFQEKDS